MKRFDELEKLNMRLAVEIDIADREEDFDRSIDLKRELHQNKLEQLDLLSGIGSEGSVISLADAITEMEAMRPRIKYETGIDVIDKHFGGGIEEAQLIMIGGEKGAGKTAFVLQLLYNVSHGHQAVFFSYEMPVWKMARRAKKARLSPVQQRNIFMIDKGRDIEKIEKAVRAMAATGKKFFAIDSLMKVTNKRNAGKRHEQISDITSRLSQLAIDLSVIIIVIVQVSKEDLKSGVMAIKGSGDADHDADIMIFFNKVKSDELMRNMICDKNRQNGNEFKEQVFINKETVMIQMAKPSAYGDAMANKEAIV